QIDGQRVPIRKREEARVALRRHVAHVSDQALEYALSSVLGRHDGVSELIRGLFSTCPGESPRDRGTASHEMVLGVEGAEDDALAVGIGSVEPLGLGERAIGLMTPVVETVRQRKLVNGQAPKRVAGEPTPYGLAQQRASAHCASYLSEM